MMYKKIVYLLLIVLMLFNCPTRIYADNAINKESLIVYEIEEDIESEINNLNELLYVFNNNVSAVSIDEYKSNSINDFDYVFVMNITNDITNIDFLEDLSNFNNKIYWIGNNIENYLDFSSKYDISYNSKNDNITKLFYKDKEYAVNGGQFNIINTLPTTNIIASMSDGYNEYPFILKDKNLYYISKWDIEESYIFEESLNDFYQRTNFNKEEVFVRIEDVHPFSDTNKLREIADYLYKENIAFIISLTPTDIDTKTRKIKTLNSETEFIDTIKYMQTKGGSVILNVNTYIKNRLLSGLRLCIENEIYPIAFKSPHDAIDIEGFKEIKKYFSTHIGNYKTNNNNLLDRNFPYTIKESTTFNVLIPENLGCINSNDEFLVDTMKDNFNKLSLVRGYSGGFSFYQDIDIEYLKEYIKFLKENNVEFLNLKQKDNYIKIDDITIQSKDGKIDCSYDKLKAVFVKQEKSKFETQIKNINDIVISFIAIILVLFLIIFIVFKIMNRRKFTRR